ncbi:hypothetical protein ALP14_102340 [Pseudomonas amygdali pv. myricae]|nr:hypothetical protein ALP46_102365 [Pseudomonas amygdali pv. myricae]RMV03316.1 hypothetical protein ALP18_102182 [Pseudomonas amygdali pv. myricae]RMV29012.1 hypothetical protein ALP14_102340 [Pseudomonas amygdali pv. myricae]
MVVKKFGYRIVPCGALQQIGYVIARCGCDANFRFVSSSQSPQSGRSTQIAWVLYGQASRAISIG